MGYERFIFWFWESPTTGWHACKIKKHFHFLIIRIYFYLICSRLPNNSLKDSFFQTPPLRDANLQWLVDFISISSCLIKRSAALQIAVTGETAILMLQKLHLVANNEFAFSFRPTRKSSLLRSARTTIGQQYANFSCWSQHETAWDSF